MTKHIPISELWRRFGETEKELPDLDHIVLTKKGKPLARLSAAPETKAEMRMKTAGAFKGTELDDDKIWKEVLRRTVWLSASYEE